MAKRDWKLGNSADYYLMPRTLRIWDEFQAHVISSDTAALASSLVQLQSEAGANTIDTISTLTGGRAGIVIWVTAGPTMTITIEHGTASDEFSLFGGQSIIIEGGDYVSFIHNGTSWVQQGVSTRLWDLLTDGDGNDYPPAPTVETTGACGAAFYVVQELRAHIADIEALDATHSTTFDALDAFIDSSIAVNVSELTDVIEDVLDASYTSVLTDYDALRPDMREQLYCFNVSQSSFAAWLRGQGKTLIADYVDTVASSAWTRWLAVGATDTSQDCSGFSCGTYCYEFDFAGSAESFTINNSRGSFTSNGIEGAIGTGDTSVQVDAERTFGSSFTVTAVTLTYDAPTRSPSDSEALVTLDGVDLMRVSVPGEGTGLTISASGLVISGTDLRIFFDTGLSLGEVTIKKLEISGTGASPTASSNC